MPGCIRFSLGMKYEVEPNHLLLASTAYVQLSFLSPQPGAPDQDRLIQKW